MPTKRTTAPANDAEAYELRLHVDNTSRFYFQRRAVEDSLLRKVKAGKYNHALAPKAFLYVVDAAARDYRKENRMVGGFNPATRMMVAKDLVDGFEGEFDVKVANPSRKRKPAAKRNPARRMTMADIKRKSLASGSHYFERGASRFFGPEKFYGPYVGPMGTFFVQKNKAGIKVKHVDAPDSIETVSDHANVQSARLAARRAAGTLR